MNGEIENSLTTLRDHPQDTNALDALQKFFSGQAPSGEALAALAQSIQHHREQGNWEVTVRLIDLQLPLLSESDRRAEALALKGHICEYELLDERAALDAFEHALALRPDDEATRETLEHITLLRENWARVAQKYVEEAEASTDRQLATSFYLSAAEVVWRNQPESPQVEEYLRRSLEVEPRNRKASAHLERLLRRDRRFQEVAKLLEQRADVAAGNEERLAALLAAGELWSSELDNPAEAEGRYRRALALQPGDTAALTKLVNQLTRQESWPALVRLYEEALRGRPAPEQEAGILLQIGLLLDRKLGQPEQAEEYFRRVRKLDPTHPLMLDFYRGYHRQRGESAKTLALLDAAARMEADPEKRLALAREMAATAEEAGNLEKAIDLWKSIQRAAPAVGEPILALKRLYRQTQPPKWNALRELLKDEIDKLGEEQAEEKIRLLLEVVEIYRDHLRLDVMVINTYNAILALRPDHEEAIEALAQKYEAMGRWNDLIGLLMRRKEVQPGAARKVETLRRVASLWIEKFGNQSQAIKPLEEILEIDARDANAIAALREIHTRRRNWRELMELLRMEAASSDQERRRQLYKEMASLAADKLGDAREGIQVWNHVLEQDPRDREALAELAALYRREERWPALAEVLHRQAAAAESSEEQLSILEALGDIYTNRLRAVENAIHAWREVLAIRPDAPKARVVLRELYVQEQRWDELDALYRSRGELAELCETLAAAADRASDRELKIRLFTKVGAIWAENLESPDRGTKAYERVLAIDPQNPAAARALVTLYRGAEKWARLLATYEILLGHAVALEEKLGLLAEIRELCEQQLGSKNLSFAWCTRAFELAPDLPELRRELERLAAEADAWEELVGILGRRLEQVSEIEPRAQLLRDLASLCMERIRRPELAEGYYRQLLELDPKDEGTLESLQQIYSSTQRWPELVEIYRRRVQLEPAVEQQVDLLFKVAFLEEERRGDPVAAIDALREVCALDAGNLRALRMLDRLYQVRSEWSALAGVLKRQLELEPDREAKVELLFRLGTLHKSHLEEHGAAIDVFAQVLGLDPVHRATVLALEGYLDAGEAAEATRVAALLQPYYERIEDWARLARVLSTLLEAEDAREPRIALLKRLFGIHSRRLDHPEAAFAAGSSLLALDPADADNRHEMSTLGERLGRTDELAGLFVDALGGLTPGASPEVERAIAWELAVILDERLGRPGEAERYLRRVIALDPARRDAFDALERILRDDGKWNELRELLEQRKELAQAPALRRDILVQISALNEDVLGDDAAAVRSYEEILQIDPSHPMSLRALERHYAASGRWQDLIDLLRREMDFAPDDTTLNELKLRQAELLAEHIRDAVAAVDLLEEVASLDPNLQAAVDLLERLMIEQTELRRRITEILEPVYERRETYRDLSRILLVRRALAADRFEAVELLRRTAGLLEEQLRAPEEALPLYIEALLLEPGTPALQDAVDRLTGELSAWQGAAGAWQGAAAAADPADIALRGNLLRRLARVFDEKLADPLQARQTYEQLLELDPNNPQTAHPAVEALARLYQAADLSAELIQVLQRKLGWSDDRQERQELRIRIATIQEEKLGQREAAVASYHELLEENPSASPALDALERIYLAGSQWRELIDILRRRVALATSPEARRSHWLRIATIRESELHDLEEATAAYLALLGDLPNDLEALRALARIYRLGERWPDLLEMLERELPLCEENEQRIAVLFEAATLQHRQLSAPAAAVERYREVLVQRPDHNGARSALEELLADPDLRPTAAQVLAPIYEAENSWEKLVQVLQIKVEGAESASARVPLLKRIAALCEDGMGDLERAFEAWRRAAIEAATEPGMLDLVRELERVGRALDRHAELAAALEAIIAEVPDPQVQRDLHLRCAAICQDRLADLERARGHFQAVLDSDPENRTALEALDGLYTTLESWSSLQEILTRRVELAPDDVARRDLLLRSAAVWRDRLGQSDEAIADYEQVLGLFANEPSAIEALDALYTATERWSSLAELLDRRLALTESRDEQIALNYRLGELRAWKMSDPPGAIAAYQTVLQLDGSHGPAVAALEAYLDDVELRVEAARVLEVIYVGRQDWPRLIRIYQIRLDSAEEPERRLWLSTRIAQLYEEQLEDLEGAFTWYGKVFLEKPSDGGIRDQLLRLAGILERWSELAAILSQLLEQTLEENETTREVALLLGSIFDERLGEVERASACYRRPLESNRDDEEAFQRLESLLTRYDRWQELLKHYQDAADAATAPPARRELLLKVCRVWEEALENLPEAIDAYRAVLDLDEHDQVPVEALDRLYNETGRWQDLADLLARRAELAESEADQVAIKQRLATIFELRVQDLPTAIDLYDEVLTRDPKHLPAVAALERLILERDQRFRISQILEPIYRRQDEWAKLVVIYDAQLDFIEDPERRQFLFREIARLHEERDGSLELAFRAIARAFLEDPGDAKLLEESERLAEKLGGWSDLVQVLTKASEGLYDFALLARLGSKIAEIQEQRLDDRNAAVDAWRRVLGAQEDHEAAISALVRLYEILGRHEELIEILTRRAELTQDPEQRKPTYYRIAEIYELLLGRTERAIDTYRQVLALDESDRVTLGALERLYLAAGTWIDLIWIYRRKIEISTEAADRRALQRQVATVYEEKLQDRFEAIAAYKVLYQETPDDPQVLEALDRLFTAEELHSDLLEVLEVKIRLEQDQEKRLGLLCRAAEIQESEIGDLDGAIDRYRQVIETEVGNARARTALERLVRSSEAHRMLVSEILEAVYLKQSESLPLCEVLELRLEGIGEPDGRRDLLLRIARIAEEGLADDRRAFAALGRALTDDPAHADVQREIDRVAAKIGALGELVQVYEDRLGGIYDPVLLRSIHLKVAALLEHDLKDDKRAIEHYRAALEGGGDELEPLRALDRVYERQGLWPELLEVIGREIQTVADASAQATFCFRMGQVQQRRGDLDAAFGSYRDALERDPAHAGARAGMEGLLGEEAYRTAALDVLEPIAEAGGEHAKLVQLLEVRLGTIEGASERAALLERIAALQQEKLGSPAEALGALGRAIAEEPGSSRVLEAAEKLAGELGRHRELAALGEEVLGGELPAEAVRELGLRCARWCGELLNDVERSERIYRKVLEVDPECVPAMESLERIYRVSARDGELCNLLAKRAEVEPDARRKQALHAEIAGIRERSLGDLPGAIAAWRSAIEVDSQNLEALVALSGLLQKTEAWSEYLEVLERRGSLLDSASERIALKYEAGEVLVGRLGDTENAIEVYKDILDLSPVETRAIDALEAIYAGQESWAPLQELLVRRLDNRSGRDRIPVLLQLAEVAGEKLGNLEDAAGYYGQVLAEDGEHLEAMGSLERLHREASKWYDLVDVLKRHAEVLARRGDTAGEVEQLVQAARIWNDSLQNPESAAELLEEILRRDASNVNALAGLARIYETTRRWDKCREVLERAAALGPAPREAAELEFRMGRVKIEESGDEAAAVAHFGRAIELDANHGEAAAALEDWCRKQKDWGRLAGLLERRVERAEEAGDRLAILRELGTLYADRLGQADRGVEALERARQIAPDATDVLTALADAYFAATKLDLAAPLIQKLIDLAGKKRGKELAQLTYRLGAIAEKRGDPAAAREHYDQAYKMDSTFGPTLVALGRIYVGLQDWQNVRKLFRSMLLQNMDESSGITKAEIFYRLGQSHAELGEKSKAITMFERGLEVDGAHAGLREALAKVKA